jgi:hypothetical protein
MPSHFPTNCSYIMLNDLSKKKKRYANLVTKNGPFKTRFLIP